MDPAARDGRRRTLLHHLHKLDHEQLLPRLLAAGLDLEARDHHQRTPLHMAVGDHGSASLVRALLAAGAATDVVDDAEWTLRDLIRRHKRKDLAFLFEALADIADRDNYDWFDEYQEDDEDDE
jgi:ankyrin repeat protein